MIATTVNKFTPSLATPQGTTQTYMHVLLHGGGAGFAQQQSNPATHRTRLRDPNECLPAGVLRVRLPAVQQGALHPHLPLLPGQDRGLCLHPHHQGVPAHRAGDASHPQAQRQRPLNPPTEFRGVDEGRGCICSPPIPCLLTKIAESPFQIQPSAG